MKIDFLAFPYEKNKLSPFISDETISFHYDKHHRAYFDNLSTLLKGGELENKSLKEVILVSYNIQELKALYNNAAQVFNHDFYWKSLAPNIKPSVYVLGFIDKYFQSLDTFKENLKKKALTQFGSGWVWVVLNKDKELEIISTSNADNPLVLDFAPILTIDVWEHAYYIDYRNSRVDYLSAVIDNLINWDFFEENLKKYLVD
ncbi:superoxide dismutase [Fe] [Candidatus Falkowbacteria bacterium HGW-Falkowbacteria-1]|jgi:Fe-Mn family superoxide dismutase|uniref:Superoxide dismutase n=1 Tax=Candidatus Falkowbacteria bacterium HGW-Falkowbacteria-1 TaxID=2013768 RepID=A0A2N2E9W2_9BACT|nr:MAG: superoxide dismutase [Fe] [Candidatus Falkowbacteria bacterium HGW-Falkowbacteria-1]